MRWQRSWKADPRARLLADRHYSRQTPGATFSVPPGRCMVLRTPGADAFWVSLWQRPEYTDHAWPGAWLCSAFRNESAHISSELIAEACAATVHAFGEPPPQGMVTFVDTTKVRRKRDFGRCFRRAGFKECGQTAGGLLALQLLPSAFPVASAPLGAQLSLFVDTTKVRRKRDFGRCFRRAGFKECGQTAGGLLALQLLPSAFPVASAPLGAQLSLFAVVRAP